MRYSASWLFQTSVEKNMFIIIRDSWILSYDWSNSTMHNLTTSKKSNKRLIIPIVGIVIVQPWEVLGYAKHNKNKRQHHSFPYRNSLSKKNRERNFSIKEALNLLYIILYIYQKALTMALLFYHLHAKCIHIINQI